MIYLARTLFLLGTLLLSTALCTLVGKLLFETFAFIIFGTLLVSFSQYLGNDLIGPKKAIKKKAMDEYREYRRQDGVTRFATADELFSSLLYLFKNMD